MDTLPVEILEEILSLALPHHSLPGSVLQTCSTFNAIGSRLLYAHLGFYSNAQVKKFIQQYCEGEEERVPKAPASPFSYASHSKSETALGETRVDWAGNGCGLKVKEGERNTGQRNNRPAQRIPHAPKTIEFCLVNDISTKLFASMSIIFSKCLEDHIHAGASQPTRNQQDANDPSMGRLPIDILRLRCNSHIHDANLKIISDAIGLVNPRKFIWTGPDPPHHFSTAIVPPAIPYLFQGLQGFTNLQELKLTHIALVTSRPSWPIGSHAPIKLPVLPSLQKIYIGQATYVDAEVVAEAVLLANNSPGFRLEEIRLVDVYKESIWGPRLRRSDLETAAVSVAEQSLADGLPSEFSAGRRNHARRYNQPEYLNHNPMLPIQGGVVGAQYPYFLSQHQVRVVNYSEETSPMEELTEALNERSISEGDEFVSRRGSLDVKGLKELIRAKTLCQARSGRINGGDHVKLPSDLY